MLKVELIYDSDCPNVESARSALKEAFKQAGIEAEYQQWDRANPDSPNYVQQFGSPTILINGKDVAGAEPGQGIKSCRVYTDKQGRMSAVPLVQQIVEMILPSKPKKSKSWLSLSVLPLIGTVMLPGLTCPACWPAYAALLGSAGIGFFNYTPYLPWLTGVFLILAVFSLAYKANKRRGYKPFILGLAATVFVIIGKIILISNSITSIGIILLITASIWNYLPKRKNNCGSLCAARYQKATGK